MENMADTKAVWLDDEKIQGVLASSCSNEDTVQVREVLAKAKELKGLNLEDVAVLMGVRSQELFLFDVNHS